MFKKIVVAGMTLVTCGLLNATTALAADRLGLGLSIPLGLSVVYDRSSFFTEHLSLGAEVAGFDDHDYVYGGARMMYWQKPENLSGFYGGPKAGIALGSKIGAAIGGEGGWQYRFDNKVDLGAAFEMWLSHSFYGGIRLNVGFLM